MAMFTFSVLDQKYRFWANLSPKNQNCQIKLKFGIKTNMQNSTVVSGAQPEFFWGRGDFLE